MNINDLPNCPTDLPIDFLDALTQLAQTWAGSPARPEPDGDTLNYWDFLIRQWVNDPSLPLFIRKPSAGRGRWIAHPSGRGIIPVDNSPPHWSFMLALRGCRPSIADIGQAIKADQIPVAMILKKRELAQAQLRRTRTKSDNLNKLGWKLGHLLPVGLNTKTSLAELSLSTIQEHFIRLMSPSNMFLVPLPLAGLAEAQVMIDAVRTWKQNHS